MKTGSKMMKKTMVWLMGAFLLMGCATAGDSPQVAGSDAKAGFLGEYYANLAPGPKDGAKMRWLKPGTDWAKYDKIMLDSVVFFFDDASEYKGIEPNELKELADGFNLAFVDALKGAYPIVAEPGPDVLRIRFAITNLEQSNPAISGVTSIIPVGLAVSVIKKGATDSWAGSGATSAEMMMIDSLTNEVIAVAQDDESAGFTERFSKWGSAEDAFKYWAERVKLYMDQVHGVKN
jgi:Protein of unknown function (DUF3313)